MIEIEHGIEICQERIVFKASRSSGPGGQNVNKLNSRVTLFFDVAGCESFSDAQKQRILKRLATRADRNGVIRVVSQRHRSQKANRQAATERLVELLRAAVKTRPPRKKTKVPQSIKQRRTEQKKRRSMLKQQRAKKKLSADYTSFDGHPYD